jgi:eukaryotic-like serine/threonine-protein kinase
MLDPAQVRDLFDRAIQLAPSARSEFLEQACGDDAPLLREIGRLIAAHDNFGDIFDLDEPEHQDTEAIPAWGVPAVIGAYRIVKELGRGGAGAVYLAVRHDEEFKKAVAIKLLQPGVLSAELVRRFRHERQILATIEHPYVAKLLDGGSTADGAPYLVMEYIDGLPIDGYCETNRLPVAERLELFCKVCAAVQFAHQNLVIHRDIKPGNILVTTDGVPKLLDFGIAKLLDPAALSLTVDVTHAESRPMTPEYASPEQIRGEPVTTASDVYSLGACSRAADRIGFVPAICRSSPVRSAKTIRLARAWSSSTRSSTPAAARGRRPPPTKRRPQPLPRRQSGYPGC